MFSEALQDCIPAFPQSCLLRSKFVSSNTVRHRQQLKTEWNQKKNKQHSFTRACATSALHFSRIGRQLGAKDYLFK